MREQKIKHPGQAMPARQVRPVLDLKVIPGRQETEPVKISLLINSPHYLIQSVFIMKDPSISGYTLAVIHQDKAWTIKNYKTVKGARIAFVKLYGYKAWREDVKPEWSIWYPPVHDWLEEKLNAEMDHIR